MGQIHKRFTNEQIRFLFGAYVHGHIKRMDVQEALAIGKSRFFELLREYRQAPETLSVSYERSTPPRLSPAAEAAIKAELLREKKLVEDPRLPISGYNYSALRDRLRKKRNPCLGDDDHGARQDAGLLQAPTQEEGP